MLRDFADFLRTTNALALALAVILGVALGAVVTSLVADILMPPIGLLLGGVNFQDLFIDLSGRGYGSLKEAQDAGAPTINYGRFLSILLTFAIVAFVVYLIAKALLPAPRACPFCGENIKGAATRCPHCTSELSASAVG